MGPIAFLMVLAAGAALPGAVARAVALRELRRLGSLTSSGAGERLYRTTQVFRFGGGVYLVAGGAAALDYLSGVRWPGTSMPALVGILAVGALIWLGGVLLGIQAGLYPWVKAVRGLEASLGEQLTPAMVFLVVAVVPNLVWNLGLALAETTWRTRVVARPVTLLILASAYVTLLLVLAPRVWPRLVRSRPLGEPEAGAIRALARRAGVRVERVSVIPWSRQRIANAMVVGYGRPHILVTDYLLAQCTPEEVEAVVAHELGHIRLHHVWWRAALAWLWIAVAGAGSALLARLPTTPPVWAAAGGWLVLLVGYFVVGVNAVGRRQELAADRYVVQLGVDPRHLASALERLAVANTLPRRWDKVFRLFQSHPGVEERVRRLVGAYPAPAPAPEDHA
ncbi:MAG: M48 family metalloprotease [Actinomycetia bacterium]|nr:M48 family metalloprotease [Actinomycetes bacterium]